MRTVRNVDARRMTLPLGSNLVSTIVTLVVVGLFAVAVARATKGDEPPLLPSSVVAAIANELSGTNAKQIVQDLTRFHRMRGSRGFRAAAEQVRARASRYGLDRVEIVELPADGKVFYGTQRSRPAWDADFAELWELREDQGRSVPWKRIASWADRPVTLAQDSAGGEATADLIDVGRGTDPSDYEDKNVRGKFVLAGAQPGPVSVLAVQKHGAAGIVSYAQNQHTAWWGEDENLIRWGHLNTFPPPNTFAFMVSLKQARLWRERLARGDTVRLAARVEAGQHAGTYDIVTGVIPGDDAVGTEEIILSCHLDHLRPGANDNASGCATILEVARTLTKLIRESKIDAPRRTIRFIWPAEVEGTVALLSARPELSKRARAVIHMDMVGGDAEITKAVFHVTKSPKSLPTFVNDVAEAFGRFVNDQSYAHAAGEQTPYPLTDPDGGKEALRAQMTDFTSGSDHQVWAEGSFRVPVVYLNDWPDRYIHTNMDRVDNIDATKLLRAGFIGAATAYYLADLDSEKVTDLWHVVRGYALRRAADALTRAELLRPEAPVEAENLLAFARAYERGVLESIERFVTIPAGVGNEAALFLDRLDGLAPVQAGRLDLGQLALEQSRVVYRRSPNPKGPMSVFGYSYFEDKLPATGLPRPRLLGYKGRWGAGSDYAYEALNLVDSKRSVLQLRDDLSAIHGPVSLPLVAEYLTALERIGVIAR